MITLKHLTVHKSLGRETHCFEATVYFNGKRACYVTNSGNGEADLITDIQPPYAPMLEYIQGLPEVTVNRGGNHYTYKPTLETICSGLVSESIAKSDLKRLMKTRILLVRADGVYQSPKLLGHEDKYVHIKNYQIAEPDSVVLNTLPFNDAFNLYKGHVL